MAKGHSQCGSGKRNTTSVRWPSRSGLLSPLPKDEVALEPVELVAAELAEEATLNATDRVKLALEQGPAYPWEIAEFTGLAVKTVKNTLTGLRKQGVVEPTGQTESRTEQVQLSVPASLSYKRDGDGDGTKPDHSSEDLKEVRELFVKDVVEESQ